MYVKGHDDGSLALLAGPHIHGSDVYLPLRKYFGDIHKHADAVVGVDLDLCGVPLLVLRALRLLPLSVYEPHPLALLEIDNIDTVRAVDGHASASGDKSHDLVSGNRAAAPGEADRHVVDASDHDPAFGLFSRGNLVGHVLKAVQDVGVRDLPLQLFVPGLQHLVDDLAFFQAAVADGGKHRIPVFEGVPLP